MFFLTPFRDENPHLSKTHLAIKILVFKPDFGIKAMSSQTPFSDKNPCFSEHHFAISTHVFSKHHLGIKVNVIQKPFRERKTMYSPFRDETHVSKLHFAIKTLIFPNLVLRLIHLAFPNPIQR